MKHTKILCTVGPSSEKVSLLKQMIKAGMNAARLNFSHGTYEHHQMLIDNIRAAAKSLDTTVAIVQDLQGPRIRLGNLPPAGLGISHNQEIILTTDKIFAKAEGQEKIFVTYDRLHEDVKPNDKILINDGLIEVEVTKVQKKDIFCRVISGGKLESHKGLNFPDSQLKISPITQKDIDDVKFGVQAGVDFIALSFVGQGKDILDLRYIIKDIEKKLKITTKNPIGIIAKIEKRDGVQNIEEIIDCADAIMIARGDLGIELPAEDVPLIQKKIIDLCLHKCKPVIVATQMLDSMIHNSRPTRAEVSDVANAVIDHADVLMLSGETASGLYPVQTVKMMDSIIRKTEKSKYDDLKTDYFYRKEIEDIDEAVSRISNILAKTTEVKLLLAASLTGQTAKGISRYRPEIPIWVATQDDRVLRQLNLSWGVRAFVLPPCRSLEELIERSLAFLKQKNLVVKGEKIVIIAGEPVGIRGNVNLIEIKLIE